MVEKSWYNFPCMEHRQSTKKKLCTTNIRDRQNDRNCVRIRIDIIIYGYLGKEMVHDCQKAVYQYNIVNGIKR